MNDVQDLPPLRVKLRSTIYLREDVAKRDTGLALLLGAIAAAVLTVLVLILYNHPQRLACERFTGQPCELRWVPRESGE
jgi:hypothetical protein